MQILIEAVVAVAVIATLIEAVRTMRETRRLAELQGDELRQRLLAAAAADLALSIEEDASAKMQSRPDVEITSADKRRRFIDRGHDELPVALSDDELVDLLHATLPKVALGAYADPRPRLVAVQTSADAPR